MATDSFQNLVVWQRSMELAKEVYALTAQLPPDERFGLSSQMRRAAISIPSNVAEGRKRGTRKDFTQFLRIADGSAAELETQLLLLLDFYPGIECAQAQKETQKMLAVMIRKLKSTAS